MAAMRSRGILLSRYAGSSLMDESLFKSSRLTVFSIISVPRASCGRCRFEPCRTVLLRPLTRTYIRRRVRTILPDGNSNDDASAGRSVPKGVGGVNRKDARRTDDSDGDPRQRRCRHLSFPPAPVAIPVVFSS